MVHVSRPFYVTFPEPALHTNIYFPIRWSQADFLKHDCLNLNLNYVVLKIELILYFLDSGTRNSRAV